MTKVTINPDKTMSIDGKKTFPQLFYGICSGIYATGTQCTTNLQRMSIFDADLIGYLGTTKTQHENEGMGYLTMIKDGTGHKDSNNFFGYMQVDEPIATGQNIAELEQLYRNTKAIDPNHVVIAIDWTRFKSMENMADVIMDDGYTYVNKQWLYNIGYTRQLAPYFKESLVHNPNNPESGLAGINDFDDINRPVYGIIQALSKPDGASVQPLTKSELRGLVYLAITMNMKGLGYYTFTEQTTITDSTKLYGLVRDQTMTQMYINQAMEIKALNDILVLPTKDYRWQHRQGTQVSFSHVLTASGSSFIDGYTNFNYMLKQSGNAWYLIVLNKDVRSISNVGITVTGLSGSLPVKTLGLETNGSGRAGRVLSVNNGQFTDSFDGLAVHIYQIGNVSASINTWTISGDKGMTGTVIRNASGKLVWNITSPVQRTLIFGTSGFDIPGTVVDANGIDQIVAILYEYNEIYISNNYSDTDWTQMPLNSVEIQDKGTNITKRVCIGTCPPILPPTKKYKCDGAPFYQCKEDATGTYDTLEACNSACVIQRPTLSSIIVTPGMATISMGDSLVVVGTAIDSQGNTMGGIPIVWSSDPAGVVEIDPINTATFIDGKISTKIKGISAGMVMIKGTSSNISGLLILDVNVAILPPPPPPPPPPDITDERAKNEKAVLAVIAALSFLR